MACLEFWQRPVHAPRTVHTTHVIYLRSLVRVVETIYALPLPLRAIVKDKTGIRRFDSFLVTEKDKTGTRRFYSFLVTGKDKTGIRRFDYFLVTGTTPLGSFLQDVKKAKIVGSWPQTLEYAEGRR